MRRLGKVGKREREREQKGEKLENFLKVSMPRNLSELFPLVDVLAETRKREQCYTK